MSSEQAAARPRILAGQMIEGETAARMLHVSRDTVHRMWQKRIIRGRQNGAARQMALLVRVHPRVHSVRRRGRTAEEYLDVLDGKRIMKSARRVRRLLRGDRREKGCNGWLCPFRKC